MAYFKFDTYEIRRNKLIMIVAINGDKIINCIKEMERTKGKRITRYRLFLT